VSTLDDWADAVMRELGIADAGYGRGTVDLVLDVARDAAHGVARPAAPLTTYLLGIAVGRSGGAAAPDLAARVSALAAIWAADHPSVDAGAGDERAASSAAGVPSAVAAPGEPAPVVGAPAADVPAPTAGAAGGTTDPSADAGQRQQRVPSRPGEGGAA